jgi:pyrroline-5-carboxylate reductase
MPLRLVLVGGGKMGAAMLEGWLQSDLTADEVLVVEPSSETADLISQKLGVKTVSSVSDINPMMLNRRPLCWL